MRRGIDVSVFQSGINWDKVKADGIGFAMIKATQGTSEQNPALRLFTDTCFVRNITGAVKAGLDVGVYHYLTAQTVAEAYEEADYYLSVIAPYRSSVSLYAAVDVESKYLPENRELLTKIINTFCDRVAAAEYTPMVYTNPNWLKHRLGNLHRLPLWLALWRDKTNVPTANDYPNIKIWQWGAEQVDGIGGNVDANFEIVPKTKEKEEETAMANTENVSEWAREAMEWAVKNDYLKGNENGDLMPKEPMTREQFAVVLYRIMNRIAGRV